MKSNRKRIIFIVGPTAVGKSDVAICLAEKMKGEIVSCDSMQVYKQVNILSNKVSKEDRKKIPHYLVDIVSLEEDFNVARFNELALNAIEDIHIRGRVPIVVGGSGMYVEILLDGIFQDGEQDLRLRQQLQMQAQKYGNQFLYDKLKNEDPTAAGRIHSNDLRRVIRALEVCLTKRQAISKLQHERQGLWGKYDIRLFALNRQREELYDHINKRVDEMFEDWCLDEVKGVKDLKFSRTAEKIIGFSEILGFLNKEYSLEEAKELMKLHTRHLAKRQLTWFRREKRLEWIMLQENDSSFTVAEKIIAELK